jgi:hypothetical protein
MVAETRDLDASFLAGLENGVGTVNFDGFVVNENIKFVSERISGSEEPGLGSENGLLLGAHGRGKAGE